MVTKLSGQAAKASKKASAQVNAKAAGRGQASTDGARDLQIIHPNTRITIGGRAVLVREYGLTEGLAVRTYMAPFTRDLMAMIEAGGEALIEDILDLLGTHRDPARQAMAQSIAPEETEASAEDAAWVGHLNDADGDLLINTWWGVCGPFFLRQIMRRIAERAQRKAFAGATSTSSSSTPASAPRPSSADTPSAS